MKFNNIYFHKHRSRQNTLHSQEMEDIRLLGGRRAAKAYAGYVPPKSPYEKWIYQNESRIFSKGMKSRTSFRIILYASDGRQTDAVIKEMMAALRRDKYQYFRVNGVSDLSRAFERETVLGKEDYVIFVDADRQRLGRNALGRLAEALDRYSWDYVYSDHDEIDPAVGERRNPFFKPDWSPDTLASFFYTGNLAAYRMETCRKLFADGFWPKEGFRDCKEERSFRQWHYAFTQSFVQKADGIGHIPEILCHETLPYEYVEGNEERNDGCTDKNEEVLVSIIIPSKDHPEILEQCVSSIRRWQKEDIKNGLSYQLIVVDNGSADENRVAIEVLAQRYDFCYIYQKMNFNFSKMCNFGASKATGSCLLFLNDDIEVKEGGWVGSMYKLASQNHVGAVGAKLYYPGGQKIQHSGVVNLGIGPGHYFLECEDQGDLYFGRNKYNYNCLAVTAACMMVRRDAFDSVGGFDEDLEVGYNDVELCFSLYEKGYFNVICNQARLYHHESASRGYDSGDEKKERRLQEERRKLYEKHPALYQKDPFYSIHLTDCLGQFEWKLDDYGRKEEEIGIGSLSKAEKLHWDIRQEWLNPDFMLQIDYVKTEGKKVSIRGWAYIKDRDNFQYIRRIVLRNEEGRSFCIGTRSRYRGYLKEQFPDVEGMEMLAFTCDFFTERLAQKGKETAYQIGMMAESKDGKEIHMIFTPHNLRIIDTCGEIQLACDLKNDE